MRHFVFSDIHGCRKVFDNVINYCEKLYDDYQCWFLGDACDRGGSGEDSFEIMKELLINPKFIYLSGNHEKLFVNLASSLFRAESGLEDDNYYNNHYNCYHNGGGPLIEYWMNHPNRVEFYKAIRDLPYTDSYKSYDMCHAGCDIKDWGKNNFEMIWNRNHFSSYWKDGRILIHGHTPVQLLYQFGLPISKNYPKPFIYKNKIDIDTGTFVTKVTSLYDLDNGSFIEIGEDTYGYTID